MTQTATKQEFTEKQVHAIFELAVIAANKAGDAWMEKAKPKYEIKDGHTGQSLGTMLDVCGFAYLNIRDKRAKFYKLAKALGYASDYSYRVDHKYRPRQELGLAEDCLRAALEVFKEHGVAQYMQFNSRID